MSKVSSVKEEQPMMRDENGMSLVLTAIALFPILVLIAVGADLGRAWLAHGRLSTAVVAAAGAGAASANSIRLSAASEENTVGTAARLFNRRKSWFRIVI
jgi:Flp pilus assembly protein TadG